MSLANAIHKYIHLKAVVFVASECTAQRSHSWKRLSFGCKTLDTATRHGIPTRGITEISGESSSGKTQICLQLCLTVQLAEECGGLAKGAVFISTEEAFPAKRLHQIASGFGDRFESIAQTDDFLNNIYIEHISETVNRTEERVHNTPTNKKYDKCIVISGRTTGLRFQTIASVDGSKTNRIDCH